jgi:uncharacterized protein YjbJ (UPF0337 family)
MGGDHRRSRCKNRTAAVSTKDGGIDPGRFRSTHGLNVRDGGSCLALIWGGRMKRRAHSLQTNTRETSKMASGKTDELKGRVKEAAGALTGDAKLKREGKLDQAVGKTKQAADKLIEKVKTAVK